MKSLLGRMGLSPLHIKRPSFIVVLNLINTFVLAPDTLFNVREGNKVKYCTEPVFFQTNLEDDAAFHVPPSCWTLPNNLPTFSFVRDCGSQPHFQHFRVVELDLVPQNPKHWVIPCKEEKILFSPSHVRCSLKVDAENVW